MDDLVLADRDGPVLTLTLNRPDRRNPLSLEMIGALRARLAEIGDAHVVVLASTGPVFCAGHDLREMDGRDATFYDHLFAECGHLMMDIHTLDAPVIAQVQGIATAAGCQLVAACDLAVASTQAQFATPGVRIGLFCTTPMVEVARAVGRKRAMEMLLTGDPVPAGIACDWGLVNSVVAPDELPAATAALAARIASASPMVLRLGKRAFHANLDLPVAQAYPHAAAIMSANATADDAQEGFAAFLGKRAPVWRGR